MNATHTQGGSTSSLAPGRWQRVAPVVALLVLSPVIVDVLFGSIRITTIFALLPATGGWGCGALIIREVVRRRRQGWLAILLLGAALATAEECIILQTSLAPLIGVDPNHVYGRAFGVNWPHFLWALGYESVWAVGLPILLVELIYPKRRNEPWLGNTGLSICAVVFVVASVATWYSWTQVFMPQFFPQSAHQVSLVSIVAALAAVVALVVVALNSRTSSSRGQIANAAAPRPWLVGIAALVVGLAWLVLIFIAYGAAPTLPAAIPMVSGIVVAALTALIVNRWINRPDWRDAHSLALVSGALLASMLAGFLLLKISAAPPVDYIGKLVLNVTAILGLIRLGMKLRRGPEKN
jgi:hypothetical protein